MTLIWIQLIASLNPAPRVHIVVSLHLGSAASFQSIRMLTYPDLSFRLNMSMDMTMGMTMDKYLDVDIFPDDNIHEYP